MSASNPPTLTPIEIAIRRRTLALLIEQAAQSRCEARLAAARHVEASAASHARTADKLLAAAEEISASLPPDDPGRTPA